MRAPEAFFQRAPQPDVDHASKIGVTPASLSILEIGTGGSLSTLVTEKGLTGSFAITNDCGGKATSVPPKTGKGPTLKVTITGVKPVSCAFTFEDAAKNKGTLAVTVTQTTLTLTGPLPSAKNASVKITPPGKTTVVAMPLCNTSKGCAIEVPAPAGNVAFAVTITDAKGHTLATSAPLTKAIKAATANAATVSFVKDIGTLTWGTLPSGASGTAFTAKPVAVTAKDADGNVIVGTYAHAIGIADADATGATTFKVNGGSATGGLTKSTDALTLNYTGLAILPAMFTASSTGATSVRTTFTPVVASIVASQSEIDLYSLTPSTTGFSGQFTATQAGWTGSFGKAFTQTFAPVTSPTPLPTNDCPGTSVNAYAITPASGTVGTSFTVSVSSGAQGTYYANYAGECTMTINGGGGKSATVLLTFTTSGIGISTRHHGKKSP